MQILAYKGVGVKIRRSVMPIFEDEVNKAIALYDTAMNGDIEAGIKVLDLYNKANSGDPTAEGLIWAICYEVDRRRILEKGKDKTSKQNKSKTQSSLTNITSEKLTTKFTTN